MPPLPKPDHERRRRNPEDRFVVIDGGMGAPEARNYAKWSQAGRDWWDALCQSPNARMLTIIEWQMAMRVPALLTSATQQAISEAREIEDRLLLNSLSRRKARVELPKPAGGADSSKTIDYRTRVMERMGAA